jgi:hypothetical protein
MKPFCVVLIAATAMFAGACAGASSTTAPTTPLSALPHQVKGYELYSWQSDGTWSFALITGTNRSKTVEEITTGPDTVAIDGWVKVSAQGVDAVQSQLRRLPANETVSWIGRQTRQQWQLTAGPFELPPAGIRDAVTAYCRQIGLSLQVLP